MSNLKYKGHTPDNLLAFKQAPVLDFFREKDPELPTLNIIDIPHVGIDSPEKVIYLADGKSLVIAAIGAAASGVNFRVEFDNTDIEDEAFKITLPNNVSSDKSIYAIGNIGQYTIAEHQGIKWNTTPDSEALPKIWEWAEEHVEVFKSLGSITINQHDFQLENEQFTIVS